MALQIEDCRFGALDSRGSGGFDKNLRNLLVGRVFQIAFIFMFGLTASWGQFNSSCTDSYFGQLYNSPEAALLGVRVGLGLPFQAESEARICAGNAMSMDFVMGQPRLSLYGDSTIWPFLQETTKGSAMAAGMLSQPYSRVLSPIPLPLALAPPRLSLLPSQAPPKLAPPALVPRPRLPSPPKSLTERTSNRVWPSASQSMSPRTLAVMTTTMPPAPKVLSAGRLARRMLTVRLK